LVARQTRQQVPKQAELTSDQMRSAILILEKRMSELEAVDIDGIQGRGESRFDALEQKYDTSLIDIFGSDTLDYQRFRIGGFDTASINMLHETPLHEIREGYRRGVEDATSNLRTIIELFQEKLGGLGESPGRKAIRAFADLDLHPEIERACSALYKDGHYANAIEDGCKVLDLLVKMRSGKHDLSGTELMLNVFSFKNPTLRFNDLETDSEKSEQQGMMFLYAGAMLAFRNPRAHELIEDEPLQSMEYIGFLSLLANALDRATKT